MSYYNLIQQLQLENAVRNSYLHQEITNEKLRRSRVQAAIQLQQSRRQAHIANQIALRKSRIQAQIQSTRALTEAALHRSRVDAEIQAQQSLANELIHRSRIDAKIQCQRIEREALLRRSRVETSTRSDLIGDIVLKSQIESEIQKARINNQREINEVLRRSRIQKQTQKISRKY